MYLYNNVANSFGSIPNITKKILYLAFIAKTLSSTIVNKNIVALYESLIKNLFKKRGVKVLMYVILTIISLHVAFR
ncbi:hypothetical protein Cp4448_01880 [Clostridium perfringens]|nr:hypothetical protein [Clostridium perfringens]SUY33297.1 Uncharacterised protein [Clostridium perfringens]